MFVMRGNLARLYALWQCESPFKFSVESFPIFRSFFLGLSFPCDAQKISFRLNMNILGIDTRKINSYNIVTIFAVCFHPRRPVAERILRVRALERTDRIDRQYRDANWTILQQGSISLIHRT